jgi:TRAP-type uncharacterized transport system fused permease subunit
MIGFAVLGMIAFSGAIQGYLAGPVPWWARLLLLSAAFLLVKPALVASLTGCALFAGVYGLQPYPYRKDVSPPGIIAGSIAPMHRAPRGGRGK